MNDIVDPDELNPDYVHPRHRFREAVCNKCHYIGFGVYTDKIGNVALIKCQHCGREFRVNHSRRWSWRKR